MKIKTIDVNARSWFDKINGNSYFSGIITLNYGMKTEKQIKMPFQYGYGDQYRFSALMALKENGIKTAFNSLWRYCDENNIILRTNIEKNCLKRDVKNFVA